MNLKEFSRVNRERCESPQGFNHALNSWSLSDWITALVGELGEAANVAKKLNRVRDGIPGNKETEAELREKFARELADTFIYLDLTAQAAGIDLPAVVAAVFNAKSEQIGSPIRFGAPAVAAAGEHTPGPWYRGLGPFIRPDRGRDAQGREIGGPVIAELNTDADRCCAPPAEIDANGRLIAASPDLLAACEAFVAVSNQGGMALAFDMATRAVAKAKAGAA